MKPTRFRYHAPSTVEEALSLLAKVSDATPLAGGQSLVPMMNLRLVQAEDVVDLNRVSELAYVRRTNSHFAIGAMTRQRAVETSAELAQELPSLVEAVRCIAYPAVRARGTIGGSAAHADPAAELPCYLLGAGATLVLASASAQREVDAGEFFAGPYMTVRAPDELLVEVRLPLPGPTALVFEEFARKQGDFALALATVRVTLDDSVCREARVAVGGAAATPVRASSSEAALAGRPLDAEAIEDAAAAAAGDVDPSGDIHGSEAYRRRIVSVVVRRALERARTMLNGEGRG